MKLLLELWADGYDSEEQMERAIRQNIVETLDSCCISAKILDIPETKEDVHEVQFLKGNREYYK